MSHVRSLLMLLTALLALALSTAWPATATGHHDAIGAHHLPADPRSPVFALGLRGGFSAGGPFILTIYGDGHLKLEKPPGGKVHLVNRHLRLAPIALRGLLKLAEAEGFFSLPTQIVSKTLHPDASEVYITITTAEGTRSVRVLGVNVPTFYELYSVLSYAAGAAT